MTTSQLRARIQAQILATIRLREELVKAGLCSSALRAHDILSELYHLEHAANVLQARSAQRTAPVRPGPRQQPPACRCIPPSACVVFGD